MTFDEIRRELETAPRMPDAALLGAMAHTRELTPIVAELVEKMKAAVYLMPGQEQLLFYGIHVLAAARTADLWPGWCDLLRLSEDELDDLLGDHSVTIVVGDDVDTVFELLETDQTSPYVRWALFQALAWLTWTGKVARERTTAFLEEFHAKPMAEDDDAAWMGWLDAVRFLGLTELIPSIELVFAKSTLAYQNDADRTWTLEQVRAVAADFADPKRFVEEDIAPIDDPVEGLRWLKNIEKYRDQHEAARPKADREEPQDPMAGIRLTEEERGWLSGFLDSAQTPDTTMDLEELDGFFCALIAGPETILPSEYMPYIWGGDKPAEGPVFDSQAQAQFVLDLLMRHWNTVAGHLADGIPYEPEISRGDDSVRGRRWADGFLIGLFRRRDSWVPIMQDGKYGGLVRAIMALRDDDPKHLGEDVTPKLHREIIDNLPSFLLAIEAFWRHPEALARSEPRRHSKVGRNEPCPCGSGRKYKKCCGANAGPIFH